MYKISKQNRKVLNQRVDLDFRSHVQDQITYTKNKYMYDYSYEPITSLPELITQLEKNIERQQQVYGNIDLIRAKHILERYQGSDRKRYASFSPNHYTRTPIPLPIHIKDFDLYIIGREGNYMSKVHDHADNGCIMKILQGELTEKRYIRDMSGNFEIQQINTAHKGTASYIHDEIGYHALGNDHTERAVGLHVYSPALYQTSYFDVE